MARKRGETEPEQDPQASEPSDDEATDEDESQREGATGDDAQDADRSSGDGEMDISDTPAPSVGPHTTFTREDPQERLARHEQSDKDAMGLDKRREVIGGTYGPTLTRQLVTYGLVILVIGGIAVGFLIAANKLDQPPDNYADEAPWAQENASQIKPAPIDFPRYGHPGEGEDPQATPGEQAGAATSENVSESESH